MGEHPRGPIIHPPHFLLLFLLSAPYYFSSSVKIPLFSRDHKLFHTPEFPSRNLIMSFRDNSTQMMLTLSPDNKKPKTYQNGLNWDILKSLIRHLNVFLPPRGFAICLFLSRSQRHHDFTVRYNFLKNDLDSPQSVNSGKPGKLSM